MSKAQHKGCNCHVCRPSDLAKYYFTPKTAIDVQPRPWGDCCCQQCLEWIEEDLHHCIEQSDGSPGIEFVCNRLSRWTVWIASTVWGMTEFGLNYPVYSDVEIDKYLVSKNVANWWCPALNKLNSIKITGDGNCLPHAVSMYLWGIQDHSMTLRRQLYLTLLNSDPGLFRGRWQREREWHNSLIPDGGLQYTDEEWHKEWSLLVDAAEDQRREFNSDSPSLPYESLEEIHIFVLANVLRRPIIILSESEIRSVVDGGALENINFGGIYLPLLWPSKMCYKYPIVVSFLFNHFEPLVAEVARFAYNTDWQRGNAVPLVTSSQEMLRIHFTLPEEENRLHNVIQNYLYIRETSMKLEGSTEQILVAMLPEPEQVILGKRYYISKRPLTPSELPSFLIDKDLVYDRCATSDQPITESCSHYQPILDDLHELKQLTYSQYDKSTRKKKKVARLRVLHIYFRSLIKTAKNSKPLWTIMTEQELDERDASLAAQQQTDREALRSIRSSSTSTTLQTSAKYDDLDEDSEQDDTSPAMLYLLFLPPVSQSRGRVASTGPGTESSRSRRAILPSDAADRKFDAFDEYESTDFKSLADTLYTTTPMAGVPATDVPKTDVPETGVPATSVPVAGVPVLDRLEEVDKPMSWSQRQSSLYQAGESRLSELTSRMDSRRGRGKCSNEGCSKSTEHDSVYCRTCLFQQRITGAVEAESSDGTLRNGLMDILQSLVVRSQDSSSWKSVSNFQEQPSQGINENSHSTAPSDETTDNSGSESTATLTPQDSSVSH